ncbi:MAG: hypothetical protein ACOCXM_09350 [Myxococcota bacterium]
MLVEREQEPIDDLELEVDHPFAPVSDYSTHAAGWPGAYAVPEDRPAHALSDRDALHAGKRELRWFALEQATQDERHPDSDLPAAEEAAIHPERKRR